MKFSVCVPNYNYDRYIGAAIESVISQEHEDWEMHISDNASSDSSVAVVEGVGDPRIQIRVNRWNVGFSGNLDRACAGATGDRMLLLSSDDLMRSNALSLYARLAEAMGRAAEQAIFFSLTDVVDENGVLTGQVGADPKLWVQAHVDPELSARLGVQVRRIPAAVLLRTSLQLLRVPGTFVSTCYPRGLYDAVEGFSAARLVGPDKFLCWKLLTVADDAIFVDAPLFQYRVHSNNQGAIQARQGALKHLIDQYINTFDLPPRVLEVAGLTAPEMAAVFVEQDIGLRGLKMLATGQRGLATRTLSFGYAAYPTYARNNRKVAALKGLLALGPIGEAIARRAYRRRMFSEIQKDSPEWERNTVPSNK